MEYTKEIYNNPLQLNYTEDKIGITFFHMKHL